jgi:methylglyoxal reductase
MDEEFLLLQCKYQISGNFQGNLMMLYRKLGSSGLEVSAVGFGAWAIGGWMWGGTDESQALKAIHGALGRGINFIDTAPVYGFGLSEELIGRAIRDRREKVVLATKCGLIWDREEGEFYFHANDQGMSMRPAEKKIYKCLRPASIHLELEQSLKRLQTDWIDLYQTHWQDKTTPIEDTLAELQKMKQEGKIRAIGVCNCNRDQLQAYREIDSDQEKFSLLDRHLAVGGTLDYCREKNISVLAYSPLANGLLTGKIRPDRKYNPGDLRAANLRFRKENVEKVNAQLERIRSLAESHRATLAQLVIAWTIAQGGITVALCGARNAQQAEENAAAGDLTLSPSEIAEIGNLVKG